MLARPLPAPQVGRRTVRHIEDAIALRGTINACQHMVAAAAGCVGTDMARYRKLLATMEYDLSEMEAWRRRASDRRS